MDGSGGIKLEEWLAAHGEELRRAWLEATAARYGDVFRHFVRRQPDPFANPSGAILREGTGRLLTALAEPADAAVLREVLMPMIRLKAVQDVPPSEALAFVPLLKELVPADGADAPSPAARAELARRLDALLLVAFDVFVECRQTVYQLRVHEMQRNVARLLQREASPTRGGNGR